MAIETNYTCDKCSGKILTESKYAKGRISIQVGNYGRHPFTQHWCDQCKTVTGLTALNEAALAKDRDRLALTPAQTPTIEDVVVELIQDVVSKMEAH